MENDPVSFVEWMTILMKAQEGLRFHWQFYTTSHLIMTGWLMSLTKKGLTVYNKWIVIGVFFLIAGGFFFNLRDYFLFLNAGYRHLTDKLPADFQVAEDESIKKDDSRNMEDEFRDMFSYYCYEIPGYAVFVVSAALLIYLVLSLPTSPSDTRFTDGWKGIKSGFKWAFCRVCQLVDWAREVPPKVVEKLLGRSRK